MTTPVEKEIIKEATEVIVPIEVTTDEIAEAVEAAKKEETVQEQEEVTEKEVTDDIQEEKSEKENA